MSLRKGELARNIDSKFGISVLVLRRGHTMLFSSQPRPVGTGKSNLLYPARNFSSWLSPSSIVVISVANESRT